MTFVDGDGTEHNVTFDVTPNEDDPRITIEQKRPDREFESTSNATLVTFIMQTKLRMDSIT